MKTIQTNVPPVILLLMIPVVIFLVMIAIPIILFSAILSGIFYLVTGRSPLELYLRSNAARRSGFSRAPSGPKPPEHASGPASGSASEDDTIECEVISARTLDENGREIR